MVSRVWREWRRAKARARPFGPKWMPTRFALDCAGVAAVEFAILLPVMLLLYVGGTEVSEGFTVKNKATSVTSAVGDLVTRTKAITTSQMKDILDAAASVITPYSVDKLKIKVSSVSIDNKSIAKVVWSAARNDTPLAANAVVSLPPGVAYPNTYVIVTEVHYAYTPSIGYAISGTLDVGGTSYSKPRLSNAVCYNNKCVLN